MKTAIFALTKTGSALAERIREKLGDDAQVFKAPQPKKEGPWLMDMVDEMFGTADELIFVSAVGIAVRAVAPHLKNKTLDPAVVVVDDGGAFAISLLSGHFGGANDLARKIADAIGAMPVITTATDVAGKPAIDLLMKDLGLVAENPAMIKKVSMGILNGESACIFADIGLGRWGNRAKAAYHVRPLDQLPNYANAYEHIVVVVGDEPVDPGRKALILKARRVYAGVGCRKGASAAEIKRAIKSALASVGLHPHNLKGLASIELKKEEKGLLKAAEYFNVGVEFYPAEELDKTAPNQSDFVKDKVGAGGVCEPAAILASKGGSLILPKTVYGEVTVALAEAEY